MSFLLFDLPFIVNKKLGPPKLRREQQQQDNKQIDK